MAQGVPRPGDLAPGAPRDLVHALHDLYEAAGLPSMRRISRAIRERDDLPDTVSHETVGQMLRGDAVPGWTKFECVVRLLADIAVHRPDVDGEVKRFHELWVSAVAGSVAHAALPPAEPAGSVEPSTRGVSPVGAELISDLPPRNVGFVGREPLIRTIHEVLRSGAPVLTLTGIGGVGKTQLAIEYLHRHLEDYEIVWWVPAEHPSQLRTWLAELGDRLGLPGSEAMQYPPAQVLAALAGTEQRWLLVFDNVGTPDSLPPLDDLGSGRVLITSRDPDWAHHGSHLEVSVFERAESVYLLRDRAKIDAVDADRLAERLGDLPLAVEQVATWHQATGVTVAGYLDDLDEQMRVILSDERAKAANYPATVPGFLNMAFAQLADTAPAATQLLELFAWLSAEPLSLTLLRGGRQGAVTEPLRAALRHATALNAVVRDLRRHGLVTVIEGNPRRIQVHRVFQHVLKDWLGETRLMRGRANVQAILAAANPGEPDDQQSWGYYAEVGSHVVAADLVASPDFEVRRVVLDQARYLFQIGHHAESRVLLEQLVAATTSTTSSEADHHLYVTARSQLGVTLRMVGDYGAAREMILDAYDYLENHPEFGPQREYLAELDMTRAVLLRIAGNYADALTVDSASYDRLRRNDEDRDKVRRFRNNVVVNLRLLGRFAEAYEIDSAIVHEWEDAWGMRDTRTLFARSNLARDLFGLGRYADALNEVRAILPIYRIVVGEKHHGVLLAGRIEVMARRKLGEAAVALRLAEQNRFDLVSWFGAGHEYALGAGISLINARIAAGDLGTARVEAPALLENCGRMFGADHPMTLAVLVGSAAVLRALGDVRGALRDDRDAAGRLREVLGAEHPYTLCAEHNLAIDLGRLGQRERALELARGVLERSRTVRGAEHPDTRAGEINVGLLESSDSVAGKDQWVECDIEPPPT